MPDIPILVYNDDRSRVLTVPSEGYQTLPTIELDGNPMWGPQIVRNAVRQRLGLEISVLQYLDWESQTVCLVDNHGSVPLTNGNTWSELSTATLAPASDSGVSLLHELVCQSDQRAWPWELPGWFGGIGDWIQTELRAAGLAATEPLIQQKIGGPSTVLSVVTTGGPVWFKADQGVAPTEGVILNHLSEYVPDQIPSILVVDPERRWMLTRHFGDGFGATLRGVPDKEWERALSGFSHLQLDIHQDLAKWRTYGLPELPAERIEAGIQDLLDDEACLGQSGGFDESTIHLLRDRRPEASTAIHALRDSFFPISLDNRDFAAHHIAKVDEGFVYFDWGYCSLSHPFFSMVRFLEYLHSFGGDLGSEVFERLISAYLEPWTNLSAPNDLREAFRRAERACPLHQAVCWYLERGNVNPATSPNIMQRPANSLRAFFSI